MILNGFKMNNMSFILAIILIGLNSLSLFAQDDGETLYEQLKKHFKKEYLSIGMVLQVVGDGQIERTFAGNNGFNISNMRISVSGKLDHHFGYFLQTNFIKSPAILDAKFQYQLSRGFNIDAGLFKAPFSKEFLTGATAIDMVNRSQVVSALVPGRQVGVQFSGWLSPQNSIQYSAGIFNGNGFAQNNNDNGNFLYAGRVTFFPNIFKSEANANVEIGVNAAYSVDRRASIAGLAFQGKRALVGADARLDINNILIAAEYLHANLNFDTNNIIPDKTPEGYHITGGYLFHEQHQILLRFDHFNTDGISTDNDWIVLGYNFWPSSTAEIQLNYTVDTDNSAMQHHQLLINAQIAF